MKTRLAYLTMAVMALLCHPARTSACSCIDISVCQAYQYARAVFIGTVLDSSPVTVEYEVYISPQVIVKHTAPEKRYRFTVERLFKGAPTAEMEVQTGVSSADYGVPFQHGERYVVYAGLNPNTNQFHTGICTRTTPFSHASEHLDYLLGLPDSATKTRISGTLWQRTNERDAERGFRISQPMSGVRVLLAGEGQRFEAVTNDQGVYQVVGLPPGKYRVEAELPTNLAPVSQEVELATAGCATVDLRTESNGHISGKLIDSQGRTVPNASVQLVSVEREGMSKRQIMLSFDMSYYARTDNAGYYQFRKVPPARYYLGVNLEEEPRGEFPFPRTYYPGVTEPLKAMVIVLGDGESLEGYDLPLPPPIPVRQIDGVFLWSDGRPVTRGYIGLRDSDQPEGGRVYASSGVNEKGQFSLQAFEGIECWVHGSTHYPGGRRMQSVKIQPFKITINADIQMLTLIAPISHDSKDSGSKDRNLP